MINGVKTKQELMDQMYQDNGHIQYVENNYVHNECILNSSKSAKTGTKTQQSKKDKEEGKKFCLNY